MSSDQKPGIQEHLWEFPCDHSLKIMGLAQFPMAQIVTDIVLQHVPDFDATNIRTKSSSSGKYVSLTVDVRFTHKDQVEGLFLALHECEQVAMTL